MLIAPKLRVLVTFYFRPIGSSPDMINLINCPLEVTRTLDVRAISNYFQTLLWKTLYEFLTWGRVLQEAPLPQGLPFSEHGSVVMSQFSPLKPSLHKHSKLSGPGRSLHMARSGQAPSTQSLISSCQPIRNQYWGHLTNYRSVFRSLDHNKPIRNQYSGHVTSIDQSKVSIQVTCNNQYWPITGQYYLTLEPSKARGTLACVSLRLVHTTGAVVARPARTLVHINLRKKVF